MHIIQAGFNIEIQKGEIVGLVGERGFFFFFFSFFSFLFTKLSFLKFCL